MSLTGCFISLPYHLYEPEQQAASNVVGATEILSETRQAGKENSLLQVTSNSKFHLLIEPVGQRLGKSYSSREYLNAQACRPSTFNTSGVEWTLLLSKWVLSLTIAELCFWLYCVPGLCNGQQDTWVRIIVMFMTLIAESRRELCRHFKPNWITQHLKDVGLFSLSIFCLLYNSCSMEPLSPYWECSKVLDSLKKKERKKCKRVKFSWILFGSVPRLYSTCFNYGLFQ